MTLYYIACVLVALFAIVFLSAAIRILQGI